MLNWTHVDSIGVIYNSFIQECILRFAYWVLVGEIIEMHALMFRYSRWRRWSKIVIFVKQGDVYDLTSDRVKIVYWVAKCVSNLKWSQWLQNSIHKTRPNYDKVGGWFPFEQQSMYYTRCHLCDMQRIIPSVLHQSQVVLCFASSVLSIWSKLLFN